MSVPKPVKIVMRPITKGSPDRFMAKEQCPGIPLPGRGANPVMVPELSILKKVEEKELPFLSLADKRMQVPRRRSVCPAMKNQNRWPPGISAGIDLLRLLATTVIPFIDH